MCCVFVLKLLRLILLRRAEFISKTYHFVPANAGTFLKVSHTCKQFVDLAIITKNFTQDTAICH